MIKYNEPEDLVPPDMEEARKEVEKSEFRFPFKRLAVLIIMSAIFIGITGMGISNYYKNNKVQDSILYIFMSVLVFLPTVFSYYYFFNFFTKKLIPYEWEY